MLARRRRCDRPVVIRWLRAGPCLARRHPLESRMKSPFPGMDPYLEEHWRDVHHSFLTYARDDLQQHLPGNLRARLEERVFVEPDEGPGRGIYPDVRVVEYPSRGTEAESAPATAEGGTALAESIVIHGEAEPATEGFIEII